MEVLNIVDTCLWTLLLPADVLDVVLPSVPLSRTTKSPAGTLLKITRKLPSPSDWAENTKVHPERRMRTTVFVWQL